MCDKTHYNNDEKYVIVLYSTIDGKVPFKEFFDSLDKKMKIKVSKNIDELRIQGNKIRPPQSKKIAGENLFELRTKISSNISRVFYFFVFDRRIVLLNGFIKKTDKTPKGEIEKAIKFKNDWLRRNEK